jgi:hypothetical protein
MQGQKNGGDGKEVCDLLVVFEDDVIIFSDKSCQWPQTANSQLNWSRWVKKAVFESAEQVFGAERWITHFPDRLFLDRACSQRFPVPLPSKDKVRFHRIVVAHNVAEPARAFSGGTGCLAIRPDIVGKAHYQEGEHAVVPFAIGRVDERRYVHVLDDLALDVLLKTLDTVRDFVNYLTKKETLIHSGRLASAAGEEDLLAHYLSDVDESNEHFFAVPPLPIPLKLEGGLWEAFCRNPRRLAQIEANKPSYFWDALIEAFSHHAWQGTQYTNQGLLGQTGVSIAEHVLRFMAKENRTRRRVLATAFLGMIQKHHGLKGRATRVIVPESRKEPHYAILLLARYPSIPDADYRRTRYRMLEALCSVTKLVYPQAQDIVGIATEIEPTVTHSEDACYLDASTWTEEDQERARNLQSEWNLLTNVTMSAMTVREYPELIRHQTNFIGDMTGRTRNKPCPCGSGKKFKVCHGRA